MSTLPEGIVQYGYQKALSDEAYREPEVRAVVEHEVYVAWRRAAERDGFSVIFGQPSQWGWERVLVDVERATYVWVFRVAGLVWKP